jgi:hypothetical protein
MRVEIAVHEIVIPEMSVAAVGIETDVVVLRTYPLPDVPPAVAVTTPHGRLFICAAVRIAPDVKVVLLAMCVFPF